MRNTIGKWLVPQVRREHAPTPAELYERVYVLESAEHAMEAESEAKPGVETGGVLAGFVDARLHAIVVTHASGPGPNAQHRPNGFNRDAHHCQQFLDDLAAASGGVLDFVGEWHKHREPDPWPSPVDEKTYRSLAANPSCHLEQVLVLITGTVREGRPARELYVRVRAFLFHAGGFTPREIRTLPDDAYMDLLRMDARHPEADI